MDKPFIYADYAATSPLCDAAREAMEPYFSAQFCNPNGMYSAAGIARRALDAARADIADCLNVKPEEVFFTAGGTEAANWAIKGVAAKHPNKKHIVCSPIEHHAVLYTVQDLEQNHGYEVSYLPVDKYGVVAPESVRDALRDDTVLVTCMFANNEIGSIQEIGKMAAYAKERGVIFFSDAVQAVGKIEVDASQVDLLAVSGHKFGGPKGIGALIVKKGTKIEALLHGGGQERNRRSGTENVPGIIGMAAALRYAVNNMEQENKRLISLRDRLIEQVLTIPNVLLTGHPSNRLPGLASFTIDFIEGESMVLLLDGQGICASSGSACSSGSLDPSHVLLAMGISHEMAHGSLRLSLGNATTVENVDYIAEKLRDVVERLRAMSPLA